MVMVILFIGCLPECFLTQWYLSRDLKETWKELFRYLREEVPG